MPMPSKLKSIEAREKKPIGDIITEKYEQFGKQKKVAEALGVSPATLSHWLAILHLTEKTVVVPKIHVESSQ